MAAKRKRTARKPPKPAALSSRVRRLERAVFGDKQPVGFVAAVGDVIEQGNDEWDDVEEMP